MSVPIRARLAHRGELAVRRATRRYEREVSYRVAAARRRGRTFDFDGRRLEYLLHPYNVTWDNERTVEVPICWYFLSRHGTSGPVLEVGNVLNHYRPFPHDVVDKYERASGVANVDIVDFSTDVRYEAIVTVSTLEHVGWDEEPRDPSKVLRAVERLQSLLRPGGVLLYTIPLGYNPRLDDLLRVGGLPSTQTIWMQRVSKDNRWVEAPSGALGAVRYGTPYRSANGLVVGIVERA